MSEIVESLCELCKSFYTFIKNSTYDLLINGNQSSIKSATPRLQQHDTGHLSDRATLCSLKAASGYTSTSLHEAVKLRLGKEGLAASAPQTIPQFFRECCQQYAEIPALAYGDTIWTSLNYAQYAEQVKQAALLLMHVGLEPRNSLGILAHNCPEWFYAELGALRAGGVVAGIYPTNSPEAVYHVLHSSEATVCVVDDAAQMAKVRAVRARLPRLRAVVQLNAPYGEFMGSEAGYYRWKDLMSMQFPTELQEELELRERTVAPNECALLIYTSGTVGLPKGVMLSHDAAIYDTIAITARIPDLLEGAERFVSYLPLNHIAAQMVDVFVSMHMGGCTSFADRNALKGTLGKTLARVRPTRFFGVPRIYEKIHEKLTLAEQQFTPIKKYVLQKCRQIVTRYHLDMIEGKSPASLQYWLATKVIREVKQALGLEHCKTFCIGGAPVSYELKQYFLSLDMPLSNMYGLSECDGGATLHIPLSNLASEGKPLAGVELKIDRPDERGCGEICMRGRNNFMGYLNDAEKTAEAIKADGWLHSGDMGYLDTQGNLVVTGRIKELVITAGGENISPLWIENLVKSELPCVSNAILVGDRRKYLTMLLTLKTDFDAATGLPMDTLRPETINWLQSLELNFERLSELLGTSGDIKQLSAGPVTVSPHPKVLAAIEEGIKRINAQAISHAQRVQKFTLLPHDFSLPTKELGPTLKIRRYIVLQKYADVIERMYL